MAAPSPWPASMPVPAWCQRRPTPIKETAERAMKLKMLTKVLGQLRCLGSPMQIKNKYGSGYQLEMFLSPPTTVASAGSLRRSRSFSQSFVAGKGRKEELERFVCDGISPMAQLLEHHGDRYIFQLPSREAPGSPTVARIFAAMQANVEALRIADYSINQPTLEQVFLRFAKEQHEAEAAEARAAESLATSEAA
eukprot:NODE_2574_length_912_cov_282.947491.p1 GENE.NODE_2574_length_912_cov_282.947491~~NODE_2574_length_912_cov_282.947491.p1  ORF type:complete len:207 (-),score=67.49 NODE_2574_length_912_cov_282.947491:291-872(-)